MFKRAIPSTGEEIPVVGLGTWRGFDIGKGDAERAQRRAVLETLLDGRGKVVDSSPMYADMGRRADAFIATKVWTRGRAAGIAEMEDSFRLLRTDTVDLMQVHNLVDWRTQLETMRAWKQEGRLRYLGYTHYRPHAFDDLMDAVRAEKVDFLQFCHSIDEPDAEDEIFPFCMDHGIATLINVPFGGGGLLSRLRGKPLPGLAAELGCASWAQYCLKYVISHPAVTCAIPGTANPDHMADLLAAADGPMPDAATRREMRASF
jgi:diketogulonate reductase-like aldo/keto reductase